jgi:hypothetical protein
MEAIDALAEARPRSLASFIAKARIAYLIEDDSLCSSVVSDPRVLVVDPADWPAPPKGHREANS